jgi:hypothetical protein
MRPVPAGNLPEIIHQILLPRVVRQVDVAALECAEAADGELYNAYLNADPHMLLRRYVTTEGMSPADAERAARALKDMYEHGARTRAAAAKGMAALDKTVRGNYCKAVAQSYRAMIEAGFVLVSLYDPRLVEMYKSHSMR